MNKKELKALVEQYSDEDGWNHYYEFPHGVKTREVHINSPGYCTQKWPRLLRVLMQFELKGKTLVDVGCSDGYFSINAAGLGLTTYGFDLDPVRIDRANLAKQVLSAENSTFHCADVFKQSTETKYDFCFGLGLLHRVDNIVECMKKLSGLSDTLILEYKTYDSDEDTCYMGKKGTFGTIPNKFNMLHGIPTNTFVENRLKELGYNTIKFYKDEESHLNFKRTICTAIR